jgi:hypothetical protein
MEVPWNPPLPPIANANIPPPRSWDEFEDIVLFPGQAQVVIDGVLPSWSARATPAGVDICGDDAEGRQRGIRGKMVTGVSESVIAEEILNAEFFDPPGDALSIATTAKRDAVVQKTVREFSAKRWGQGKFSVGILFWDDIVQDLARDLGRQWVIEGCSAIPAQAGTWHCSRRA